MKDEYNAWKNVEKFLDPKQLKSNLIRASVFLSAYELLKGAIVEHPRTFFGDGINNGEDLLSPDYKKEVIDLSPKKDIFDASCRWFVKTNAISKSDLELIGTIRSARNEIAHQIPQYLTDVRFQVKTSLLESVFSILDKIEHWWIRNFEIPINPDYDDIEPPEIPDEEIVSLRVIAMQIILNAAQDEKTEEKTLAPNARL